MRILIAPQAFKGTLSAMEVALAIQEGVLRAKPSAETLLQPIADGGDGTLEILLGSAGKQVLTHAADALGRIKETAWGVMEDGQTAVIELARICGLAPLTPSERDILRTTTFGLGQVIKEVLDHGFKKLIIGLGGSASNDAGAGAAQALGVRFLDAAGKDLAFGGAALIHLAHIDRSGIDPRLHEVSITLACDVTNPILGETGATAIYAPQKGASVKDVEQLERALEQFCKKVHEECGIDISRMPYGGAAGGTAAGMHALFNAHLSLGAEIVLRALQLDRILETVDLVITGEGCLDAQTSFRKAPFVLAQLAKQHHVPTIAIAGIACEPFPPIFHAVLSTSKQPVEKLPSREVAMKAISNAAEKALSP